MKLPLSWLNDYVKVDDIDPKELAEKLTRAGLQVKSWNARRIPIPTTCTSAR